MEEEEARVVSEGCYCRDLGVSRKTDVCEAGPSLTRWRQRRAPVHNLVSADTFSCIRFTPFILCPLFGSWTVTFLWRQCVTAFCMTWGLAWILYNFTFTFWSWTERMKINETRCFLRGWAITPWVSWMRELEVCHHPPWLLNEPLIWNGNE